MKKFWEDLFGKISGIIPKKNSWRKSDNVLGWIPPQTFEQIQVTLEPVSRLNYWEIHEKIQRKIVGGILKIISGGIPGINFKEIHGLQCTFKGSRGVLV